MINLIDTMCINFELDNLLLLGDFNLPVLSRKDWFSLCNDDMCSNFLNFIFKNLLKPILNSPTAINKILDLASCHKFIY